MDLNLGCHGPRPIPYLLCLHWLKDDLNPFCSWDEDKMNLGKTDYMDSFQLVMAFSIL